MSKPSIKFVRTGVKVLYSSRPNNHAEWSTLLSALARNPDRNEVVLGVIDKALFCGRTVLVISDRLALAKLILKEFWIPESDLLCGATSHPQRERVRQRVIDRSLKFVVATFVADDVFSMPLEGAFFDCVISVLPKTSKFLHRARLSKWYVVDFILPGTPPKVQPSRSASPLQFSLTSLVMTEFEPHA